MMLWAGIIGLILLLGIIAYLLRQLFSFKKKYLASYAILEENNRLNLKVLKILLNGLNEEDLASMFIKEGIEERDLEWLRYYVKASALEKLEASINSK